ncbi:hypothetical protein CONLIGDRAFT_678997 [Coniochaeta ligniaria NRRL 30616]|uniref:Uncharacterized protein n=1 Tax=Coniochaeta ligniaria NRRL 30616 TaxID=1408157 RepID=A0A1J7IZB4_9PEZI|nr:hypothetical protein CONLIGDRAFT_678997 [Coniochaeta ligniaria NRRL 30616]
MDKETPKQGPSLLPEDAPKERRSLHIQAISNWMSAANGGHIPAPGEPDKAIDSLMNDIEKISLDTLKASIPEEVKAQVPDIDELTEEALKSIVVDAAKLSMADKPPSAGPHQWDNLHSQMEDTLRCWTNGTSACSCRIPPKLIDGLLDDGLDIVCGLDCPIGCSQAEIVAGEREKYSPCCGDPACVCTSEEDHVFWLCHGCGQATCRCEPEPAKHDDDEDVTMSTE